MTRITRGFFQSSKIPQNSDTIDIMDFLSSEEGVDRMLAVTKMGLPALAGVVKELEERFAHCTGFPLDLNADDRNAPNRRSIGWMVKYVMHEFGYTPVESGLNDRCRLGFTKSRYFSTSAIYTKTDPNPNYTLNKTIV